MRALAFLSRTGVRIVLLVSCVLVAAPAANGSPGAAVVEAGRGIPPAHGQLTDPVVIPLNPYMGRLRTIDVRIGDVTLPFLFDTAGGFTAITPQVAERLGITPFGRVTGFRASGERLDAERAGEIDLEVPGLSLRADAVVFDLMGLLPAGWPELGGLVSLQTFREHVITVELAENRLTVETEKSLAARVRDLLPMSTRINTQTGGSLDLFVEVKAQRGNLWLELDGGNLGPLLLAPHALAQLGLADSLFTEEPGGPVELDYVGLGPVGAQALRADIIYDGVVDAATVEKLVLTMDLRTGKTWGRIR